MERPEHWIEEIEGDLLIYRKGGRKLETTKKRCENCEHEVILREYFIETEMEKIAGLLKKVEDVLNE